LGYEPPEEGTVVPKRVGVIQDCTTVYAVCALFALVKVSNLNNNLMRSVEGNSNGVFSDNIRGLPGGKEEGRDKPHGSLSPDLD
jgi:hypothetical protein